MLIIYCVELLGAATSQTLEMFFFIFSPTADCPKPPEKEHLVLTDESLLKNGFPKDTKITYICTNGYEKHNGSNSITCTGAEWTEPDLMCKSKPYPHFICNKEINRRLIDI